MTVMTPNCRAVACGAAVACVGFIVQAPLAGCSWNGSPIHLQLSPEELQARVRESFHVGMASSDVKANLNDLGLKYSVDDMPESPCGPAGKRGFEAQVYEAGFRSWLEIPGKAGQLLLWTDGHSSLTCVAFRGPWNSERTDRPMWTLLP